MCLLCTRKKLESIHDESLAQLKAILEEMKTTHQLRVELRARERVRRADFIGRDLVIVLGGDGTLTSISHNIDENTPSYETLILTQLMMMSMEA